MTAAKRKRPALPGGTSFKEMQAVSEEQIAQIRKEQARWHSAEADRARLREALRMLYNEQVDYINLNHLGDPHHNRSMQLARAALDASDATDGKD